jgi:hypothetical protein|uniref:Uncharacterized protein n=1 Tax=Siphoviridae sp. ctv838 TaxID=2827964 RepID=A0A8S5SRU0_9CAUD|nr:MAG TPA: hypothetical protein [Siphoviridae sp. ctv838]
MSLVEEFFKQYDELASKYEKHTEIFKNQGAERPAEVANKICVARKENKMPSTIYLVYFEGLLDDDFLLECMNYFIENSPRVHEVAKEARESFIESITDAGIKTKKPSKRRVAIKKYYQERAWLLGI